MSRLVLAQSTKKVLVQLLGTPDAMNGKTTFSAGESLKLRLSSRGFIPHLRL